MARTRRVRTLEERIESAKAKMERTRIIADNAQKKYESLLLKKESANTQKILEAIVRSGKSMDEICTALGINTDNGE